MKKDRIFISHSSRDINYVKPFVEKVLILGLDISADRIFCSSLEGQGVRSGQYIPDRLREEINCSSLALLFVSKDYKASEVCLNEVGAAWAVLTKETVVPLLLPSVNFNELGFIDLNRLGLKIYERDGILKLIEDCKGQLNPDLNIEKLYNKIEDYINEIRAFDKVAAKAVEKLEDVDEWTECFTNNLCALDEIIRKAIPAYSDGVHKITDLRIQNQILTDLSTAKFLRRFWYRYANGDAYVKSLKRQHSGNWLMSIFNWEIKISEMWVCMNSELQYEFVLIRSEKQEPYQIQSDIGGVSYNVGVLNDGTVVSENERLNGYAIIRGETINLHEYDVEPRMRSEESHWVFLVSDYHKAGYNPDETIDFCEKLDSGKIEVNQQNIYKFLRSLRNNPVVIRYR